MAESDDYSFEYLPDFGDPQPYFEDRQLASMKVPPNSIQAEQAVLGALMLDNNTWDQVADRVGENDFYRRDHRLIFRAISFLAEKQEPFDVVTLAEILEKHKWLEDAGGLAYLGAMARDTPSAANVASYADIVRERSVLRQLIASSSEIADSAYHPKGRELSALVEEAEQKIFRIADQRRRAGSGFKAIRTLLSGAVSRMEELFNQKARVTGISTGFTDLDEMTSGLQRSDLVVVAGRPSMGKCLGSGTLVLMYSGELRKVEDLRVGDLLMGNDSTPRKILSLARGQENLYWVRQNKGIDYRVNESHILSLRRSWEEDGHVHGEVLNIELREYLRQSDAFKSNYQGYKVAVEFSPQALPVEPYSFGLSLDGGNTQIPQAYLINSTDNRLQLLAGLIDGGGYFDAQCGGYDITRKDQALARQIKFLCDTLGFRASLLAKPAEIKTVGFASEVYCVRFFGDVERIPVKLARKQAQPWTGKRSWRQTGITVEFDRFDDYYGFELDGNGLFLLEDLTVTHNTTFAMNIAENVAMEGKPVAVFSMEMPGEQLAMRMMSSLGRIDQHRVRTGKLENDEWPRVTSAINMLADTQFFIDDTPALTPVEVRARCRRLSREYGQLGLVVLDYLQLMQVAGNAENRVNEISEISRSLKALAKEMSVPVIALSQLNRNLEQRTNKRPMPSDLRESGSIEQDADIIMFIYRDEVYNPDSPDKGKAEIIIAKQRNGPIGTVNLTFLGQYTRFENYISPSDAGFGPPSAGDVEDDEPLRGGGFQLPPYADPSQSLLRKR